MTVPAKFYRTAFFDYLITSSDVYLLDFFLLNGYDLNLPVASFMEGYISMLEDYAILETAKASGEDDPEFMKNFHYHTQSRKAIMEMFPTYVPRFLFIGDPVGVKGKDSLIEFCKPIYAWIQAATGKVVKKSPGKKTKTEVIDKTEFLDPEDSGTERKDLLPYDSLRSKMLQDFVQSKSSGHHDEETPDRLFCVSHIVCIYGEGDNLHLGYMPPLIRIAKKKMSEGFDKDSSIVRMKDGARVKHLADSEDFAAIKLVSRSIISSAFKSVMGESATISSEKEVSQEEYSVTTQEEEEFPAARATYIENRGKKEKPKLDKNRAVYKYKGIKEKEDQE